MSEPTDPPALAGTHEEDRLDSWKAISAYLKRDVTTVQRWEKREGMPIHRHLHDKLGSVYAFRSELDLWMRRRNPVPNVDPLPSPSPVTGSRRFRIIGVIAAGILLLGAGTAWWWSLQRGTTSWSNPLEGAQFQVVTDFDGTEQAAAVSRDGRLVAFTSDRDGAMDVWVTQVGTGQYYNLTKGRVAQLVNPAVRTLGFSPDGTLVTFWARGVDTAAGDEIGIWAIPTLGGQPRPYLEGVAEFDWSRDGRLIYHTPGPGDPTFVGDADRRQQSRPIFAAAAGLHAHFPTWSPDGTFIYFVQGTVPDGMDIWRMRSDGQQAERITQHNAAVSHPILLDDRTLMYLASVGDGSGSRLHVLDVNDRVARVLGTSLDRYSSLAAGVDGRRVVATRANPKGTIWRLSIAETATAAPPMTAIPLPTGRGSSPRMGPGYVLYVSPKGADEAIWKLSDGTATELWSAPGARIIGGPEITADGKRVAFSVDHRAKTILYVMNSDGTNLQRVSESLQLRGAPAWAPDGLALVSGASMDGAPHLVRIALDGRAVSLIGEFGVDPVWSPAGDFIVYSAADIGTEFPVRAVSAGGEAHSVPSITLTRGARRLRFSSGRVLLAMRGDIRHKDVWLIDLETGKQRQVTQLPPDFNIRDFDVSADGGELLIERVQEHSDVVLIDLARRE